MNLSAVKQITNVIEMNANSETRNAMLEKGLEFQ